MSPAVDDARVIDRLRGDADGPTLLLVGGVHGNEPAGVDATRAAIADLRRRGVTMRGEVIGLVGNVRALAAHRRYLARDLNRLWTRDRVAAARNVADGWTAPTLDGAELTELAELSSELEAVLAAARGPVIVLDLHTTSAAGIPFGVVGPTEAHRALAAHFPMPCIAGLEEQLEGVLTGYLGAQGCVTLAVEGGQTDTPEARANLDAVVAIGLVVSGVVAAEDMPGRLDDARALLARSRGDLPTTIEVVSRHPVKPSDEFRMEPGFANIQRTPAGTLLAHDHTGEIRAPFDGLVLLPLYQPQGSDGFFYGREVS